MARPALRERGSVWRRSYDERPGGASIIRIFVSFGERGKGAKNGCPGLGQLGPTAVVLVGPLIPENYAAMSCTKREGNSSDVPAILITIHVVPPRNGLGSLL